MMQATRTEEDLLGAREVPLEAYWGIHTLRAMENFQISGSVVGDEEAFVRGMVQVKKASALANSDLGALDSEVAGAIVWACDQVLVAERCLDQFPVDQFQGGAGTSVNMNTNEVIANLALEYLGYAKGRYDIINPNDHVNKSQSTNDAYPTGFRLGLFTLVDSLIEELERFTRQTVVEPCGHLIGQVLEHSCIRPACLLEVASLPSEIRTPQLELRRQLTSLSRGLDHHREPGEISPSNGLPRRFLVVRHRVRSYIKRRWRT